jgi:uridine kinase
MRASITKTAFIEQLRELPPARERPNFIAISGFGGSGKSTLAKRVGEQLGDATVIPVDDFIIGARDQRSGDWATFDRNRLRKDILAQANVGESLCYQVYNSGDFVAGKGGHYREITVGSFVIVEGCSVIHPDLIPFYDYSAWIDLPQERALVSAKCRDATEIELFGNDDTAKLWDKVWGPNDQDFFETFRPDLHAAVLIEPQF